MNSMDTGITCRCNGQLAQSPICALLSASHKSTLVQTAADLIVMLKSPPEIASFLHGTFAHKAAARNSPLEV